MALFPGLCFRLSQTKEMTVNNNESDKEQMKNLNVIECNYTAPLTGGSKINKIKMQLHISFIHPISSAYHGCGGESHRARSGVQPGQVVTLTHG